MKGKTEMDFQSCLSVLNLFTEMSSRVYKSEVVERYQYPASHRTFRILTST